MAVHSRGNYISLFAGVGGLDLALSLAVQEARCVCYVERDIQAATILVSRIKDESIDDAPVWSDITTFDGRPWRAKVDGIIGGFPCQDLSTAGSQKGIQKGNRSGLWYEYVRIIREVQPRWIVVENVPGILRKKEASIVFGELSKNGFNATWGALSAFRVGASHGRERVFILAWKKLGNSQHNGLFRAAASCSLAATVSARKKRPHSASQSSRAGTRPLLAWQDLFAPGPESPQWKEMFVRRQRASGVVEPTIRRVADGLAGGVDSYVSQIRAVGNGVVAVQGAAAIRELVRRTQGYE